MFKSWFGGKPKEDTPPEAPVSASQTAVEPKPQSGLDKLKSAMSLTSKSLIDKITSLGRQDEVPLTEETLDEIEETLIQADVGVDLAVEMTDKIRANTAIQTPEKLKAFLRDEFMRVLTQEVKGPNYLAYEPGKLNIYLVVGVNGSGKTTLIGKLANRLVQEGKKVVIGAGDVFRAAAEDQLAIWAQRAGAELVRKDKADAAAVIYESIHHAMDEKADVLILDTAGRLQNKFNLMEELKKIKLIIDREAPADKVYESLLVIDATTGQNALRQAEVFLQTVDLTGVALTKLDGSAKGGIVLNIARQVHLPVKCVGVGEKIDDIRDFDPQSFIEGLFER